MYDKLFQFSVDLVKATHRAWFVENAPGKISAALGKNHCIPNIKGTHTQELGLGMCWSIIECGCVYVYILLK